MDELPIELNVITLNCWGRKRGTPHRAERMTAIGRYLATTEPVPHIVALQECFEHDDYLAIRQETRFTLPFGKLYHSGPSSCGLVILSRWPIEESSMVPFSLCGRPARLLRGDFSAGAQGIACARIRYGEGEEDVVEVFNTNVDSTYGEPSQNSSYMVHRLSQAWQIAKLVRNASERGHLAVVLAGLDTAPFSLPYRLLTSHATIRDAWRVMYPDSSLGPPSNGLERARGRPTPTAAFNVTDNGVTSNSPYNTWSWSSSEKRALHSGKRPMLISPEAPDEDGQRVDYIFFSRGGNPHAYPTDLSEILSAHNTYTDDGVGMSASPPGWVVKDTRVGLMARHPDFGCSLSDHFSVNASLILHTPTPHHRRRRQQSRSRSRSRSPSPTREPTALPSGASIMNPTKKPGTVTQIQPHRGGTSTPSTHNSRSLIRPKGGKRERERERGRPVTPHSFTSTEAGITTIGARATAIEQGTYLPSPTASSFRRSSRDRAAWDYQLSNLELGTPPRLPLPAYDEILHVISRHAAYAHRQRQLGVAHFAFWCAVLVGSAVGIWFLPDGKGAFGLLVGSSLGLVAGVASLLLSLLFYAAELNKLSEFEWEILNAKAVMSGMVPDALAHQGIDAEMKW
ncbi:Endonuclease/exonuclease/phosphatase [Astrocystis sublimbata]|nr:Endonuclease/exonuclease/phosphatase [Astrocystis sublimbata]